MVAFHRAGMLFALSIFGVLACSSEDGDDSQLPQPSGAAGQAAPAPSDPEGPQSGLWLTLDDGQIQGEMAGAARLFRKIPFAKPPLGELRWKAPLPNEKWTGVRHEEKFAEGCAQNMDQGAPASHNEDCLYLNVWTPEPAPKNAAVMVWIHGGGNFSGGAGIPLPTAPDVLWYNGQVFAEKQGIVLVTIQYRLGPMGFFAHAALADEDEPVGNQGLLDQRLALQWVQKNIAKFGGDPDNVTIFGESAGSADVCYHVASPGSRGLFHRAISQSGGCTIRTTGMERTLSETGSQMEAYGKAVGCEPGAGQLACMRKVPIEKLLANAMQPMPGAGGTLGGGAWSFAAVRGGENGFLPDDSLQSLFDRGEIAKVPYLLGANNDEGTTFVLRATPLKSDDEYMADLTMRFGDAAPQVAALYPPSKFDGDWNAARARVIGDGVVCSTHDTARRAATAGLDVFLYNFNVAWSIGAATLKAGHAAEISHVFGVPHLPVPDPASEAVGIGMNTFWANFAKTGDPNGPGAPALWPRFTAEMDRRLQLDPSWMVLADFRTEECAFWRQYNDAD